MNIMVFDVAAEKGGALTVLKSFHKELSLRDDTSHSWIFVTSIVSLPAALNITVLKYPWIKKSWFHRIYFDLVIAPMIIKKNDIDLILSLQNTLIPIKKSNQLLFVHQMLPFSEHRIPFNEDKLAWIYQNIIKWFIFWSIHSASHVYVQAEHIKKRCIELIKIDANKISVIETRVDPCPGEPYLHNKHGKKVFFYPADSSYYKNHRAIVDACSLLSPYEKMNVQIIFTLVGNESSHINQLCDQVERFSLPILFIGKLTREEVYDYYSRTILLFPSYIETLGLPLIEAKQKNCIILASNCPYAHEALGVYPNAYYFDHTQAQTLAKLISEFVAGNYTHSELSVTNSAPVLQESLLLSMLKYTQ